MSQVPAPDRVRRAEDKSAQPDKLKYFANVMRSSFPINGVKTLDSERRHIEILTNNG